MNSSNMIDTSVDYQCNECVPLKMERNHSVLLGDARKNADGLQSYDSDTVRTLLLNRYHDYKAIRRYLRMFDALRSFTSRFRFNRVIVAASVMIFAVVVSVFSGLVYIMFPDHLLSILSTMMVFSFLPILFLELPEILRRVMRNRLERVLLTADGRHVLDALYHERCHAEVRNRSSEVTRAVSMMSDMISVLGIIDGRERLRRPIDNDINAKN